MVIKKEDFLKELGEAREHKDSNALSSSEHAYRALKMLEESQFPESADQKASYESELQHLLQLAWHQMGRYVDAYGAGLKALQCETELTSLRAAILRCLAITLYHIGLLDKALEYCEEAYQIAEFTHDEYMQAEVSIAFGLIYEHFDDYEKQLAFTRKAFEIFTRLGVEHRAAIASNNMAHSYMRMNHMEEAKEALMNVIRTAGLGMGARHTAGTLVTLGELQNQVGNPNEAEKCFKRAVKSGSTFGLTRAVFYGHYEMAKLLKSQNRHKAALNHIKQAHNLAEETTLIFENALCHEFKSEYFRERKLYKKALEHLERSQAIREQIRSEKTLARTQILLSIHEMESIRHDAIVAKLKSETLEEMVRSRTEELQLTQDLTLQAIAALAETRDVETGNHIKRTSLHVKALVQLLKDNNQFKEELDSEENRMLPQCAMLHDIGKVGISDAVLLKPGRFNAEEFEDMKKHTLYGYQALRHIEEESAPQTFLDLAALIAISHHERWDGSGYPNGLAGDDIPLPGRIMAIVDVYDALVSKRYYKEAYSHAYAIRTLAGERGKHFDPRIADVFVENHEVFRKIALQYADSEAERLILEQE